MENSAQHRSWTLNLGFRTATAALAIAIVFALAALTQSAQAQTFTVLHTFTGGGDGGDPLTGLTMDSAGNFYGTTWGGGTGYGTVFKLWHVAGGWRITPLYSFAGGYDGAGPSSRVIFGPDGALYGTASTGGAQGYGLVWEITP